MKMAYKVHCVKVCTFKLRTAKHLLAHGHASEM